MKRSIVILACLFAVLSTFAQGTKNFIDLPYIEVSGTAEFEVTPDEIYLNIVIDEDDNSKISVEKLEQDMLKKLKAMGIDLKEQLTVKDLSSDFKKYFIKKDKIHTAKEFELLLHDAPTLANVFIELEKLGISNLNIIKLDHSNMDQLKLDVKIEAIKAAKTKAETFASAIDQEIGKAIHIAERQNYNPMNRNVMIRGYAAEYQDDTTLRNELDFDKLKLSATVDVKFELK